MIQQSVALELSVQMESHCIKDKEKKTIQPAVNQSSFIEFSGLTFHLSEISSTCKTFGDVVTDHFSEEDL